jgi:hypothetical protein
MATKKTELAAGTSPLTQNHTIWSANGPRYTPDELKTLMEAIGMAPSWMSKRFIMQELCGWSEARVTLNAKLKTEEDQQSSMGNRTGGYR